MSHAATNWAIKQRGLKPATKIVLFYLADRHNPDYGCFPSQKTLAEDAEMSERSVRDHLDILEQMGLIQRISEQDGGRFKSTRYVLAFEPDFQRQNLPSAKSASGKNEQPPAANSAGLQRQNLPTNPVKEPCKETSKAARDRVAVMQGRIVEALGLTGRELNTRGTFVVKGMDVHNLTASLEVWAKHGLTDDQIILAIRAKFEVERGRDAGFMPGSLKFFDGPVSDFAKRLADGTAPKAKADAPPPVFTDPEIEAEHRELTAELARLRGSNSDKAFNRRSEIIARLQALQAHSTAA